MAKFIDFTIIKTEIYDHSIEIEEIEIGDQDIKTYVVDNFEPGEVYSERELSEWAEENNYIQKEED